MSYCQKVHDLRQCPVVVGSPQTQTQRDQVVRIISVAQSQASLVTSQRILKKKRVQANKFTFPDSHSATSASAGERKRESKEEKHKEMMIAEDTQQLPPSPKGVEVVDVNICLGNWPLSSRPTSPSHKPDPNTSSAAQTSGADVVDLEISFDLDPIAHPTAASQSSCFYLPLIYSLNTNNKTPPPSPTQNKSSTPSWFSRSRDSFSSSSPSASPSSSRASSPSCTPPSSSRSSSPATTPTWKDQLRGLIRRSNTQQSTSSTTSSSFTVTTANLTSDSVMTSTPPLTPTESEDMLSGEGRGRGRDFSVTSVEESQPTLLTIASTPDHAQDPR
jgi:hypothetical protein